ncbi:MAG: Ig domain-containing protein [Candidatus Aenigmatarchaeota archaeon]
MISDKPAITERPLFDITALYHTPPMGDQVFAVFGDVPIGFMDHAYHGQLSTNPEAVPGRRWAFTVDSGELPPGIELNFRTGELYGTPTSGGLYPVTFRVSLD